MGTGGATVKIVLTDIPDNHQGQCEYPDPSHKHRCPKKATVHYRMSGSTGMSRMSGEQIDSTVFHYCTEHADAHLSWGEGAADIKVDDRRKSCGSWECWEDLAMGIYNSRSVCKIPISGVDFCPACEFLNSVQADFETWVTIDPNIGWILVCEHKGYPWPGFPQTSGCLETYNGMTYQDFS
jgi:hypothetical protein